jgi:hypothetical protein
VEGLNLHWEAAPPELRRVLRNISQVLSTDLYYLAGGTALSLLEGHRVSVDLDVFSSTMENPELVAATLEDQIDDAGNAAIGRGAVYLEVAGVQVSIIAYRYPLLNKPLVADPELLPIASLDDIAAMKLSAITSRGTRKDFVDLWTIITRHHPLEHYLRAFETKFAKRDVGHVLRSLAYFDDADQEPPIRMINQVSWSAIKDDFRTWLKGLLPRPS